MNIKKESMFKKENIGIGKRKQSVARVFVIPGNGNLLVNNTPGEKYFQYNTAYLNSIWSPLKILKLEKQFDIIAIIKGGGLTGQTEALQLGITRSLCMLDNDRRSILKPYGLLTRDARIKERKKYGLRKARKAPQYSKR